MQRKKKICKSCDTPQYLFSKGRCERCAKIEDFKPLSKGAGIKKSMKPIKKQTEKNKEKRKTERAGFGDFFVEQMNYIKDNNICCQECGTRLNGEVTEVAHIIKKSTNPEIALNSENILYLCFYNGCHAKFDSTLLARASMKVFEIAAEKYKKFKHLIIKQTSETRQLDEQI